MKQSELIKQLSEEDLRKAVVYSQILFLLIAFMASFILFDSLTTWTSLFQFDYKEIVYYGVVTGIIIVLIDLILIVYVPVKYYDDGGINKRIFTNLSPIKILFLTLLISIAEESLFRGVVQSTFGYLVASIIFAIVHVRYLKKPVLLTSVLIVSFILGYLYEITNNLFVTITAHFIVDFLLGLAIRYKLWGD
ncbi:CPBP family intramembrane glutamic endopeptidase [Ornithinibacillus californiensis]|uniref:CPBP family intramembrane glutamic endopeptidase n=1 Tax=Ornithinibacillus californiensis TaxID=161536 RepID=UPI00064D9007|nr:CPBP family intramembrane glutamic endopeptidase [Ornithinibacillus californiensis]